MPIEAAHVRFGSGAGMGQKPCDFFAVPLCRDHHAQQHTVGEGTFWFNYERASGQTAIALIDALCAASPKAAEIRRIKQERGQ